MNGPVININGEKTAKTALKIAIAVVILVALIVLGANSFTSVPTGFIGVRTQFGAVIGNELSAGLQFKVPFIQEIEIIDCRTQKIEADANAASKDLQNISSKIAVNFSVNAEMASELYKKIGNNYKSVIIDPAVQEVVKMITAQFTAEEIITKRSDVSMKMTDLLTKKIAENGIKVEAFNVINFDFSEEFNNAIESKQIAQQQALKAEQDLNRIKIEAEQKKVQAQAEADSLRLQKQEITEDLLELRRIEAQLKAIEKWDGKLPTYNGGDAIPFIDITKSANK